MVEPVGRFKPGRYIQFPNVTQWVHADLERACYRRHLNQDFGIVPDSIRHANHRAIMHDTGDVVSEFAISDGRRIRFTTTIGFKTVALIVGRDGQVETSWHLE
ncbi:hypothetical protein [Alicyclobacillus sp.]|uniref:hypothetical protein n=1 Tax=Alicyclobacillus sp. TaxID=61169 RepID=UPI0025C1E052|nr:hypothetical protein [Alicyclobacillus sp.]MCL6517041.1 hypothetical protein [Alicyclobacillus sp.]